MWRRLKHPNIVPFLGVPTNIPPLLEIVCEWMANGTITEYVRKNPMVDRISLVSGFVPAVTVSFECQISQLWDVADGLHYLHSRNVIHGDLKGVSHSILHSRFFSGLDVNLNESEGKRSDRQKWPRSPRGLCAGFHYLGRGYSLYYSRIYSGRHNNVGGTRNTGRGSHDQRRRYLHIRDGGNRGAYEKLPTKVS